MARVKLTLSEKQRLRPRGCPAAREVPGQGICLKHNLLRTWLSLGSVFSSFLEQVSCNEAANVIETRVSNSCAPVILTSQLSEKPRWRTCATTPGQDCYFIFKQGSFLLPQPLQQLGLQVYVCQGTGHMRVHSVCVRTRVRARCLWRQESPTFSSPPLPSPPALVGRVLLVSGLPGLACPPLPHSEITSVCYTKPTFS